MCDAGFIFVADKLVLTCASIVVARSIFKNAIAAGASGLTIMIIFLFCSPNIKTLFTINAPQPFVFIYTMALGRGGGTAMTVITSLSTLFVSHPSPCNCRTGADDYPVPLDCHYDNTCGIASDIFHRQGRRSSSCVLGG